MCTVCGQLSCCTGQDPSADTTLSPCSIIFQRAHALLCIQVQYKQSFEVDGADTLVQALHELDTARLVAVLQQAMHVHSGEQWLFAM